MPCISNYSCQPCSLLEHNDQSLDHEFCSSTFTSTCDFNQDNAGRTGACRVVQMGQCRQGGAGRMVPESFSLPLHSFLPPSFPCRVLGMQLCYPQGCEEAACRLQTFIDTTFLIQSIFLYSCLKMQTWRHSCAHQRAPPWFCPSSQLHHILC